jgi:hypothetical protein
MMDIIVCQRLAGTWKIMNLWVIQIPIPNTNNQHPVRNHAKGRLCSTISNSAKIKDEDISIDLQMGFLGD